MRHASRVTSLTRIIRTNSDMSSTTMSSASFQSILDAALDSYSKQTGIDLTKHSPADKLQNCRSPDDVLQILSERELAFKDYRDKYRNLIDRLRPVVQVAHAFSAVLGEAAVLVSSGISYLSSDHISDYIFMLPTGTIPTNKRDICRY
jgi:fungal STAND N-terminal Goodbye domain